MFEAGEQVYVTARGQVTARRTITRVTKTQAIIETKGGDARYNRETGREVGAAGPWETGRIEHRSPSLDARWRAALYRRAAVNLARAANAAASEKDGADEKLQEAIVEWAVRGERVQGLLDALQDRQDALVDPDPVREYRRLDRLEAAAHQRALDLGDKRADAARAAEAGGARL